METVGESPQIKRNGRLDSPEVSRFQKANGPLRFSVKMDNGRNEDPYPAGFAECGCGELKITNNHNLPEPVYKALTTNNYSRGKSDLSVTQLIDSPRVRILKQRHAEEITEDASEMLWSVWGTAVHTMFEQHEPDGHIVERLYATVGDWVISGAIDLQRSEADGSVTILDYKCTSV